MTLNIVTRTSGRPNYFKKQREGIKAINGDVKHWVTWDREEDLEYLKEGDLNLVPVGPLGEGSCPWNRYLNKALEKIDGWVLILDDDDGIKDPGIVKALSKSLKDPHDVAFWKVKFGTKLLPDKYHWRKEPRVGQISMIGMCFHTHWVEEWGELFSGECLGDWRLAQKFWHSEECNIHWIDKPLTGLNRPQTGGHGKRDDLES